MADQKPDVDQELHELERQKYKLHKELSAFQALGKQITEIEAKAHKGDDVARRQMQQLEALANGEIGQQMQALLKQLDELQAKFQRFNRLSSRSKKQNPSREKGLKDVDSKLKKKRRNRIKYL